MKGPKLSKTPVDLKNGESHFQVVPRKEGMRKKVRQLKINVGIEHGVKLGLLINKQVAIPIFSLIGSEVKSGTRLGHDEQNTEVRNYRKRNYFGLTLLDDGINDTECYKEAIFYAVFLCMEAGSLEETDDMSFLPAVGEDSHSKKMRRHHPLLAFYGWENKAKLSPLNWIGNKAVCCWEKQDEKYKESEKMELSRNWGALGLRMVSSKNQTYWEPVTGICQHSCKLSAIGILLRGGLCSTQLPYSPCISHLWRCFVSGIYRVAHRFEPLP
eukprot:Gb_21682 [translate_table: standard]